MSLDNLLRLLKAIFTEEGYFDPPNGDGVYPRPRRYGNPGDLRSEPGTWEGQAGTAEGGFCVFPLDIGPAGDEANAYRAEMQRIGVRPADYWGYRAARLDVTNHAAKYPQQTLLQFIGGDPATGWTGYAPASDANNPREYADKLGAAVGRDANVTFGELA